MFFREWTNGHDIAFCKEEQHIPSVSNRFRTSSSRYFEFRSIIFINDQPVTCQSCQSYQANMRSPRYFTSISHLSHLYILTSIPHLQTTYERFSWTTTTTATIIIVSQKRSCNNYITTRHSGASLYIILSSIIKRKLDLLLQVILVTNRSIRRIRVIKTHTCTLPAISVWLIFRGIAGERKIDKERERGGGEGRDATASRSVPIAEGRENERVGERSTAAQIDY